MSSAGLGSIVKRDRVRAWLSFDHGKGTKKVAGSFLIGKYALGGGEILNRPVGISLNDGWCHPRSTGVDGNTGMDGCRALGGLRGM